jgi:hypothetical protein
MEEKLFYCWTGSARSKESNLVWVREEVETLAFTALSIFI